MAVHIEFADGSSETVEPGQSGPDGLEYTKADGNTEFARWADIRVIRQADEVEE